MEKFHYFQIFFLSQKISKIFQNFSKSFQKFFKNFQKFLTKNKNTSESLKKVSKLESNEKPKRPNSVDSELSVVTISKVGLDENNIIHTL